MVGKIFLAKIFFTDLSKFKLRPILILKEYKSEDFLFLPLTTNLKLEGVEIKSSDLVSGKSLKSSVIIIPKISIIHKSLLIKEIGSLKPDTLLKVKNQICSSLECFEK